MKNDKSGIYKITCRPTGEIYVGSSSRIYRRWYEHRMTMRRGASGCWLLQKAWTKYGEDAFWFEVIEECAAEDLEFREQFYINELKPELNVLTDLSAGPRSLAIAANKLRWEAITHCPQGHEYTAANTYTDRNGSRICRKCNADRVAGLIAAESEEEKAARLKRNNDSYYQNYERRRATAAEYAAEHRKEKRAYDRQHRAEQTARKREAIRNQTPEEHTFHLKQKRIAYHRSKGRGDVDTWERPPISEELKAKISATLTGRNLRPRNEPWVAEGISKTQWYRRLKQTTETPEQREARRAEKRASYHANGDKEREKMRLRYRRSREELRP